MNQRGFEIAAALRAIIPGLPPRDRDEIVENALASRGLRQASPQAAAWLSAVAYIRHAFTDYDDLLADGYGEEAARHFCLDQINQVLADWGCRKRVRGEEEEE